MLERTNRDAVVAVDGDVVVTVLDSTGVDTEHHLGAALADASEVEPDAWRRPLAAAMIAPIPSRPAPMSRADRSS